MILPLSQNIIVMALYLQNKFLKKKTKMKVRWNSNLHWYSRILRTLTGLGDSMQRIKETGYSLTVLIACNWSSIIRHTLFPEKIYTRLSILSEALSTSTRMSSLKSIPRKSYKSSEHRQMLARDPMPTKDTTRLLMKSPERATSNSSTLKTWSILVWITGKNEQPKCVLQIEELCSWCSKMKFHTFHRWKRSETS